MYNSMNMLHFILNDFEKQIPFHYLIKVQMGFLPGSSGETMKHNTQKYACHIE
jgi:hypothetical protein